MGLGLRKVWVEETQDMRAPQRLERAAGKDKSPGARSFARSDNAASPERCIPAPHRNKNDIIGDATATEPLRAGRDCVRSKSRLVTYGGSIVLPGGFQQATEHP